MAYTPQYEQFPQQGPPPPPPGHYPQQHQQQPDYGFGALPPSQQHQQQYPSSHHHQEHHHPGYPQQPQQADHYYNHHQQQQQPMAHPSYNNPPPPGQEEPAQPQHHQHQSSVFPQQSLDAMNYNLNPPTQPQQNANNGGGSHHGGANATPQPPPSASRITDRTFNERLHHLMCVKPERDVKADFSLQSYLINQGFVEEEINTAVCEHTLQQIDMCISSQELQLWAGPGVTSFFSFARFVLLVQFVIMLLQIINFANFVAKNDVPFSNEENTQWGSRVWYDDFFITIWPKDLTGAWLAINIICIILMFAFCVFYFFIMGRLYADVENDETKKAADDAASGGGGGGGSGSVYKERAIDRIIRFNDNGTIDVTTHYRSTGNLILRRLASFAVFLVLIGFQVIASINIQGSGTLAIAVLTAVLNAIYTGLGMLLTEFEKHEFNTTATRWYSIKLMLFKLVNIITVFAAKDYSAEGQTHCVLDVVGRQFASLLLVEIVLTPIAAVIIAALRAKFYVQIAELISSINGDNDNLPPFDIATEYLTVCYKMYLGTMAMAVFPLGGVMVFVALVVEYTLSRFRCFKICGQPQVIAHTSRGTTSIVWFFLTVAALATPVGGLGYMLSGTTSRLSSAAYPCTFPQ